MQNITLLSLCVFALFFGKLATGAQTKVSGFEVLNAEGKLHKSLPFNVGSVKCHFKGRSLQVVAPLAEGGAFRLTVSDYKALSLNRYVKLEAEPGSQVLLNYEDRLRFLWTVQGAKFDGTASRCTVEIRRPVLEKSQLGLSVSCADLKESGQQLPLQLHFRIPNLPLSCQKADS